MFFINQVVMTHIMNQKKILFIITDLGSYYNFLYELVASLLEKSEIEIYIICSQNKVINVAHLDKIVSPSIKFYFIEIPRNVSLLQQVYSSIKINKLIKLISPDLIHAHFTTGIFTTVLLKFNSIKIWGTFHGLGYVTSKGLMGKIFYLIELFCFFKLDKIIVLNNIDFESVPKCFHFKRYKHKSIGIGCDLDKFNLKKNQINPYNSFGELHDLKNRFVILFTGRYVKFKGFHLVIKTFLKLSKNYNDKFKLILIGGVDKAHETGLSLHELQILNNHIDIINIGFTNEVHKYLEVGDLFFFPSKKEGMPVCIMESFAMGLPVLTLNSRGCGELVINNFNGVIIDETLSDDKIIDMSYRAIISLFNNPNLLQLYRTNILENREKYSRKNFVSESITLYEKEFGE